MNDAWRIVTELMLEHGLPVPEGGLGAHSAAAEEAASKLFVRTPAHSTISFEVELMRVRTAFSNIPLWHALLDDINMVGGTQTHLREGGLSGSLS